MVTISGLMDSLNLIKAVHADPVAAIEDIKEKYGLIQPAALPIGSVPSTDIDADVSNAAVFGDITFQTGGQSIGILGAGGTAGGGSYPVEQIYSPSTEIMNNISNQVTNTISNFYSTTTTENITTVTESPESSVSPYVIPNVNLATTVIPSITTDQTGQTPTLTTEQTASAGSDWMQYIIAGVVIIGGIIIVSQLLKKKKGGRKEWI